MTNILPRRWRSDIQKNVLLSIERVTYFQKTPDTLVDIPMLKVKQGISKIRKIDGYYLLDYFSRSSFMNHRQKVFQLELKSTGLDTTCFNVLLSEEIFEPGRLAFFHSFKIPEFLQGTPSTGSHHRLVVPLTRTFTFQWFFSTYGFDYERTSSSGLIKTKIGDQGFDIYQVGKFSGKEYLFIDCMNGTDSRTFYDKCFAILLSLGFLTGHFAQDECYIITSSDSSFQEIESVHFRSLRRSISTQYLFLESNPYNVFPSNIAPSYQDKMSRVSPQCFDALVNLCYHNQNIANSILIMLEASGYPLDTQPACLSVSLEGICNEIMEENNDRVNPIADKKLAKTIRDELQKVIDTYANLIGDCGCAILKKKIDSINSPTNQDKLVKPFELLGLKLKDFELKAIANRNNFLHSRGNVDVDREIRNRDSEFYRIYFTTLVLTRLLYLLVLKKVGYTGSVVNILKNFEDLFGEFHDEERLIELK